MHSSSRGSLLLTVQPSEPASDFWSGCRESVAICASFSFLFFSVGALAHEHGYSFAQAVVMTAAVFAAPLQVFVIENGAQISLTALVAASLLINFRFLVMASALSQQLGSVPLTRVLLGVPMLSASTFAVSTSSATRSGRELFRYYIGVGAPAIAVAVLATAFGYALPVQSGPWFGAAVSMILPIHFSALTGLLWPKLRMILATALGFAATPFMQHWLGETQVVATPIAVALGFCVVETLRGRRS